MDSCDLDSIPGPELPYAVGAASKKKEKKKEKKRKEKEKERKNKKPKLGVKLEL